jgi:chorismate mutase/prephenate dehydratase
VVRVNLDELRKRIDELDEQIVRMINERARVVLEIAEAKSARGEPFYAPSREGQVYKRIRQINEGPISDVCLQAVYREIISGSLALEIPLKVAYLGPEGTFTHSAARSKFGDCVQYIPGATMDDVFTDVEHERADYGVVPVENSTGGGIHETLTRFLNSPLKVCGEIVHDIHHSLMASCEKDEIERIYSRPQVFGQTRSWLQNHLPDAELIGVTSTSVAAEQAARDPQSAAIGSAALAADHGLKVLFDRIEDYSHNVTRFFVLGPHSAGPTGDDKTAMLCSIDDRAGALHDLLDAFKRYEINMSKIESFPSPDAAWQYYFFIDFMGHPDEDKTRNAVEEMKSQCDFLKILGAFPRAKA